ncbi:MAG: right-handed parallel beta-helix repeat-containing protein [Ardenticatenia bacterium]|nr:right-handed parallel beta-helix repeat-containing protein [Ardenticatenia bacterium]
MSITVDGTTRATTFSLTRYEGDGVTLTAPETFDTAGGRLTFRHWMLDDRILFPTGVNALPFTLLRDGTLTAVYTPEDGPGVCRFTVEATFDDRDANPGDGVCAGGQGPCTLRAAIQEANALPGACLITVPPGTYTLAFTGANENAAATGDLDVTDDLTILGAGADVTIVDGNGLDTVFDILPDTTVEIYGLTIRGGNGSGTPGGVDNEGTLTLGNCVIADNAASGNGGGVWNTGTMTLRNCRVAENTADLNGGGLYNRYGTLTLIDTEVISNTAELFAGGGLANNAGTVVLERSTVSGNNAGSEGGGIWNDSTLTLVNSTLSGNAAETGGGGLFNRGHAVNLNNVTIADNTVFKGDGGGVENVGTLNLKNTLIAGNVDGSGAAPDCGGTMNSQGYNLIQNPSGCTLSGDTTGNLLGVDPLLGPLADNGGATRTHALLPGSPAIDAGNPAAPGSGGNACAATDQRGVARPQGTACDIGAYEAVGPEGEIPLARQNVYLPLIIR